MAPRPEVEGDNSSSIGMSFSCGYFWPPQTVIATLVSHNFPPAIPLLDEKSLSKEEHLPPAYSTLVLVKENEEAAEDPWDLPELKDTGVKWSGKAARFCDCSIQPGSLHNARLIQCFVSFLLTDLDTKGKILRVLTGILKLVLLLGLLYMFICSLDVLSSAFQLVGGKTNKQTNK